MDKITPRQQQIFELIQEVIDETGMPPTRAEIAETLGFKSANAAEEHLRALARKGMITLLPGAARGIRITDPPGLPVVGRVAAGSPILAEQHLEGRVRVDPRMFKPKPDYLLRVRGMSMRDAGIMDGDLVAVSRVRGRPQRPDRRGPPGGRGDGQALPPAGSGSAPIAREPGFQPHRGGRPQPRAAHRRGRGGGIAGRHRSSEL